MISHIQLRGKSVSDLKTTFLLASSRTKGRTNEEKGRLAASGKHSSGYARTSGEAQSIYPSTFTIPTATDRRRRWGWVRWSELSSSSSSSANWWLASTEKPAWWSSEDWQEQELVCLSLCSKNSSDFVYKEFRLKEEYKQDTALRAFLHVSHTRKFLSCARGSRCLRLQVHARCPCGARLFCRGQKKGLNTRPCQKQFSEK